MDNLAMWAMQRPATNIPQGLLLNPQRRMMGSGLLLPAAAAGGQAAGLLSGP
jgi:hypothetical protein